MISDGVVALDGTSLAVKDNSRFLVRSVAAAFDAHLDKSRQQHSQGSLGCHGHLRPSSSIDAALGQYS